ncbi:hypothetical protein HG537_0G03330 [Torulaspora globosa]|uniref:Aminotransferase class I/classII large domain-containing protein n=1 Tax=Torulaspora globosa TaxID=48254 RepID=A0A7H9HWI7_9SACH|nr:hypothetical protein HG537_0G03330 [Torulaspora sp. CBS 2947]
MSMDQPVAINLFKGHPSFRLLPNKLVSEATVELLKSDSRDYDEDTENRHPLTYGSDEGALWVREAITRFNNDETFRFGLDDKARSKPEFLNLNSGASYGMLSILLQTTLAHTGVTRQAFVVTPTYFLINDCFTDAGFSSKVTAIDEDSDGMINLSLLEQKLEYFENETSGDDDEEKLKVIVNPEKSIPKKVYKYVMYCIPTYSNPSGASYSIEIKMKLIEIARKYDMLIIADDVYDMLDFTPPFNSLPHPQKRFVHLDRETLEDPNSYGNTISNATFSKLIAPGLRFGYHETATSKLAQQLSKGGANVSGGTPSQLTSMIVGTMLQNGSAAKILCELRTTYAERAQVLTKSVKLYMPRGTKFNKPAGGYFSWLTLPQGYNAKEIGQILQQKYGVLVANGSNFEVIGDLRNWGESSMRLSVSFLELNDIERAIKYMGKVCSDYAKTKNLEF